MKISEEIINGKKDKIYCHHNLQLFDVIPLVETRDTVASAVR